MDIGLGKEILTKIVSFSTEIVLEKLKKKLKEKDDENKLEKMLNDINKYALENYTKEGIVNHIEKHIYNNVKRIHIFSDKDKNICKEEFFEKYNNCLAEKKEIEQLFEEYFFNIEIYISSKLNYGDKVIIKKINDNTIENKREHKKTRDDIKRMEGNLKEAIKEGEKLAMISIEEMDQVEFRVYSIDNDPDEAIYNFYGNTVDYTNLYDTSYKSRMQIKVKNVGNSLLSNINIKKFQINSINNLENDSYGYDRICLYEDPQIIGNSLLPWTSSQINFIFYIEEDSVEDIITYDLGDGIEFEDYEETFTNVYNDKLNINICFELKVNNNEIIEQNIELYCSKIKDGNLRYSIDSVVNSFNISVT